MELRHLRYFTAVAEESTLIAAARRLGVAQPALTRQIHALEAELGVELLERGPKGVTLTPAGDVVHASARHILRQVDAAVERARGAGKGTTGRCVICVGTRGLASGLIGRVLERVRTRYPAIELGVIEATGPRQFRSLQLGDADIGLGVPATKEFPQLLSETVDYDVFDAILIASGHPIAARREIALQELRSETFLTWHEAMAPDVVGHIRKEFSRLKFKPAAQRKFDQVFALSSSIAGGGGWTLVFRDVDGIAPPGTTIVPLTDLKVPLAHAIIWRAEEPRPVVLTVLDVIREVMTEERAQREGRPLPVRPGLRLGGTPRDMAAVTASAALELRHFRYFCAVVDAGSFGRAAEQLGLTQPALSRQVADLERVVATPLLERAARGVSATPAGDAMHRSAKRLLDEAAALAAESQRARRGVIARCVLASVPTPAARALLTALLKECSRDLPDLELVFEDMTTPTQPPALREGTIDLGICHASPMSAHDEREIERLHLTTDTVNCALVAETSPLAARDSLNLRDLADVPFIFPDRAFQPAMHDVLFALFDRLGFQPRVDATYHGLQTIWTLVAEGLGWGLGFASQCAAPPAGTVAIPIEHFSMPWGLDLLMRDDESRSLILDVADRLHGIARTDS